MGYYHFIQMMRTTTWLGLPAGTRQLGLDEYFPTMGADIDSKSSKKWWLDEAQKWGDHADMNQLK